MNFWSTLGLQLLFALFVAGAGHAAAAPLARRLRLAEPSWLERLCFGAVLVVATLAVLGWLIALSPWAARRALGIAGLALLFLASIWTLARGGWRAAAQAPRAEQLYGAGYLALCVGALMLALWPVRLPASLPDGAYVAKHDLLPVRVQYSTGNLPTDNALPHVVSEYLLRDIAFLRERPIMPGQEVTNRPILAALTFLPFRAAFRMPQASAGPLPRFEYVGTQWPDFSALMRDETAYRISQAIGISLNALLLLGAGAFALRIGPSAPVLSLSILGLALSSPYVLFQTYFTWPKALAGFFLLMGWLAATRWRSAPVAGVSVGLAYLSHPYAIVFLAAHMGWHGWNALKALQYRNDVTAPRTNLRTSIGQAFVVLVAFAVVTAPWFVWSKWMLQIPTDLVAQNFIQAGQRWRDFAWVRPVNFLNTFLPVHLLAYPFDVVQLVRSSAVNFAGAVGFVTLLALVHRLCAGTDLGRATTWWLWIFPSALLVLVFSNQAVPALHGLQALVLVGIAAAAVHLWDRMGRQAWMLLFGSQVVINGLLMLSYLKKLG